LDGRFIMLAVMTLASWWGSVSDLSGRHLGALFGLMNSLVDSEAWRRNASPANSPSG